MQDVHTGGCLCGSVQFSINGKAERFFHCHCKRCRKSTGTGHCSNLFVATKAIQWTNGENQRRSFKVPDAERFTRHFCSNCGGPLPAQIPGAEMAIIPAGTLDTEPDLQPQARIFQNSRTKWSCSGDAITCFDQYPE